MYDILVFYFLFLWKFSIVLGDFLLTGSAHETDPDQLVEMKRIPNTDLIIQNGLIIHIDVLIT